MSGGTVLTIEGVNLGHSYDEIKNGVSVNLSDSNQAVPCIVLKTEPHDSTRLRCRLNPSDRPSSGVIHVKVGQQADSIIQTSANREFTFYVSW